MKAISTTRSGADPGHPAERKAGGDGEDPAPFRRAPERHLAGPISGRDGRTSRRTNAKMLESSDPPPRPPGRQYRHATNGSRRPRQDDVRSLHHTAFRGPEIEVGWMRRRIGLVGLALAVAAAGPLRAAADSINFKLLPRFLYARPRPDVPVASDNIKGAHEAGPTFTDIRYADPAAADLSCPTTSRSRRIDVHRARGGTVRRSGRARPRPS
jgi:hypothetical protein